MKTGWFLVVAAVAVFIPYGAKAAVLANVGDIAISEDQVKSEYESADKEQRKAINADESTRRQLVENVVNAEILVLAAKKAGFDKDADYKKAMEKFQRQYLASRYLQKHVETKLTKAALKDFFDKNKPYFDNTQVCAQHIVVEKQADAESIAKAAKASGANFEQLAIKNSIDPTVQENKGNLGCFTRERMVPEFSMVAFTMKKGEIQGPVRTAYGFHIIKVNEVKPGAVPSFDEVEQRVKESYRMKVMNDLVSDLRSKSKVKINEDGVKKFRL